MKFLNPQTATILQPQIANLKECYTWGIPHFMYIPGDYWELGNYDTILDKPLQTCKF